MHRTLRPRTNQRALRRRLRRSAHWTCIGTQRDADAMWLGPYLSVISGERDRSAVAAPYVAGSEGARRDVNENRLLFISGKMRLFSNEINGLGARDCDALLPSGISG